MMKRNPLKTGCWRGVKGSRAVVAPLVAFMLGFAGSLSGAEPVGVGDALSERHQQVLALQPVGYWPADEGKGEVLHDLSDNANHGAINQVPWKDNLLDFTGAYQWLEIPNHPRYQMPAFSIGGWVFKRESQFDGWWAGGGNTTLFGNAYGGSDFTVEMLYDTDVLYQKSNLFGGGVPWDHRTSGISLCLRRGSVMDVVSGGRDALGTQAAGTALDEGEWLHVLYTYDSWTPLEGGGQWLNLQDSAMVRGNTGVARLYINGDLVKTGEQVPFAPRDKPFLVGSDAGWWLQSNHSGSLNGSIRDLVMFDRALDADEVRKLVKNTHPAVMPVIVSEDALVLDGRDVSLVQWPALSVDDRRRALEQIEGWEAGRLRGKSTELAPVLIVALDAWPLRRAATALLVKLDDATATSTLEEHLPHFVRTVEDASRPREERAETVLAIREMKMTAQEAVPALATVLEQLLEQDAARVPRVEDLLRNALIRSLLDVAPDNERTRELLGRALAKPVLTGLDLAQPQFAGLRALIADGRYMDALEASRGLEGNQAQTLFFSHGDPHRDARRTGRGSPRAYTGMTERNGTIYKVGTGEAWRGVGKISPADFEAVVARVAERYPEAKDWRSPDDPHLYRVPITKIDPDGKEQTIYLEGEDFIIGTADQKYWGWSIAVDTDGYVHVTGGMHNAPNPKSFIPGSWEEMGASYDYRHDDYPNGMFWVSREPGDIATLEFVGQRGNPRGVSVPLGINYMNYTQDRYGILYLYGRIYVQGIQSWGLYRYDVEEKRWAGIGGFAPDVKRAFPEWTQYHVKFACDWLALPTMRWRHDHRFNTVLAWARQAHFYNYIRSWGVKFDPANRMHVQVELFGFDEAYQNRNRSLYAWSDDGGQSFHRADGTPVALPLTVNPGPGNTDLANHSSQQWWDLWLGLLRDAGYSIRE